MRDEGERTAQNDRAEGISLIIPAYNEEDRISKSLDSYLPVLRESGLPYEVIVVMDGKDGTHDIVLSYKSQAVKGFTFDTKLGKGGAVRKGIELSGYGRVCWVDADGSLIPEDLKRMIEVSENFDCVVASRWLKDSVWLEKEPLFNLAVGRVFNFLVRGLLHLPVMDTQCGAKIFRSDVAKGVLSTTVVTNRTFDVAMLYHAMKLGATIREVGVRWRHDHETRMPIFRVIPIMFITLLGIRVMNLPIKKYVPNRLVGYFVKRYARD